MGNRNGRTPQNYRKDLLEKVRIENEEKNLNKKAGFTFNDVGSFFNISGVYFLFKEKKLVYIGESACVLSRISQHIDAKLFDSFKVVSVEGEQQRKEYERRMIKQFAPIYNYTHNPLFHVQKAIVRQIKDTSNG